MTLTSGNMRGVQSSYRSHKSLDRAFKYSRYKPSLLIKSAEDDSDSTPDFLVSEFAPDSKYIYVGSSTGELFFELYLILHAHLSIINVLHLLIVSSYGCKIKKNHVKI